ncbi:TIGR04540 family protein [Clostridium aestuarii]|uniref:TIGR04540 family protein n=1 Tax=Clostridium aestuarii TaxID=338193 RepID=A0ABT4D2S2_9CLOT|nr:TIGR04540 family protein [Clostridium aestuarii]MCY6485427.1 TIGR04540 family protein [Clostridium aestuarii]
MDNINIRLYYKNQLDLGNALKSLIDSYFENNLSDSNLEENIVSIVNANKDKFYKNNRNEIASKPKQLLGKTRIQVLEKVLNKDN